MGKFGRARVERDLQWSVVSQNLVAAYASIFPHLRAKPKIWIDLDNTPHVIFFEPIIKQLKARGFPVLVTARDAFQVCELAEKKGLT